MYIKELSLENFRSAKNLKLELNESINVFVGINGAGKTTVLDACSILLSEIIEKFREPENPIIFRNADINNAFSTSTISIILNDKVNEYKVELGIGKETNNMLAYSNDLYLHMSNLLEKIDKIPQEANLPLFAYYPVGRAIQGASIEVQSEYFFSMVDAYENCLENITSFKAFFKWFRLREDLENENNRREKSFTTDKQLDFVRKALSIFMPQITDIHIQRNPLRMVAKKDDEEIYLNQLSDGEKCLLALIGDIARRLAIANSSLENPLHGEGVVLIDEIDLHLHPTWQQMIIPQLRETFPNCQFLISTHSPHVLTHVESNSVFMLENTEDGLIAHSPREMYGKTSETILKSFMGLETTRPKEVASELDQIFVAIHDKKLTQAQKQISALEEKIGDDPELVKARALVKRMELIGK